MLRLVIKMTNSTVAVTAITNAAAAATTTTTTTTAKEVA
jgi:hypothetical protein